MKKVRLCRGQLFRAEGIDITVKSATGWARAFAPTWEMVMGHKQGRLSDEEYSRQYRDILARVPKEVWKQLYQAGKETGRLRVLCYCREGKFCHTHLLIAYACERWPKAFEQG